MELIGNRTYISMAVLAIYNLVFPLLGIKDVNMDVLDSAVNVILLIIIAIFHKIHKPK